MKDNVSYCSILLDNNTRKWICRLYYNGAQKVLAIANEDKSKNRIPLESIDDLYRYQADMTEVVTRYLKAKTDVEKPDA